MGATIRSWNSSTASAVRPTGWVARFSSVSTCMTIAVEESASARPTAIAAGTVAPVTTAAPPISTALIPACRPPAPSTARRNAHSRSKESSRPRRNNRNSTPSSAKGSAAAGSAIET